MEYAGAVLYHGTSAASSHDILANGIDLAKCSKGYFGEGFYLAEDYQLAKSNYADFCGDVDEEEAEPGAVLACKIADNARILQLCGNEADWEVWQAGKFGDRVGEDGFWMLMMSHGIDGVADNSFGGVVIYNPAAVVDISLAEEQLAHRPRP